MTAENGAHRTPLQQPGQIQLPREHRGFAARPSTIFFFKQDGVGWP
jgi:hypothetical protein